LLINDLLIRATSYYTEIPTNNGKEFERMREVIHQKTGLFPSIYDNGTRYVLNMELNLEMLRGICKSDESITKVAGHYAGVNRFLA
jgi:hypothetical protein